MMGKPVTSLFVLILLLVSCSSNKPEKPHRLNLAEEFIDAFYSFDPAALKSLLSAAEESVPSIIYYQGWAEGGNYEIIDRKPCVEQESDKVSCSVTVRDDPMLALGVDFNVTDTFHISFTSGNIISVKTTSNDLQIYHDAADWVRSEMPELVREPCQGFFEGGPTPGACARAMARGYAKFSESIRSGPSARPNDENDH